MISKTSNPFITLQNTLLRQLSKNVFFSNCAITNRTYWHNLDTCSRCFLCILKSPHLRNPTLNFCVLQTVAHKVAIFNVFFSHKTTQIAFNIQKGFAKKVSVRIRPLLQFSKCFVDVCFVNYALCLGVS